MVECKICGKSFLSLTSSGHLRKHKITSEEYKKEYPNEILMSDETKKRHSDCMQKRVKEGNHFVPFRDIEGFAKKIHDKTPKKRMEYKCIRCGKIKTDCPCLAKRRKFCSNKCHADHIRENPDLYVSRNTAISKSNIGRPKSGGYSRCRGGFRKDIGHYVRSRCEADVCRIFKYHNKPYSYESFVLSLQDGKEKLSWVIDFVDPEYLLSNGLIEVKGWWDRKSKKKSDLAMQQFSDVFNNITFIDVHKMNVLRQQYASLIPEWESTK